MADSFEADVRVIDVARRYGVSPQQVTTWRRQTWQGRLSIPVEDDAAFAGLLVEEPHPPASSGSTPLPIEIEADGVIVRLAGLGARERGMAILLPTKRALPRARAAICAIRVAGGQSSASQDGAA